jgi:drug/metabolite transporter (DMT)-like permease
MKTSKSLAITFGLVSSLFFALSFILNRMMSLSGGSWLWSSSLRFILMLPLLLVIVAGQHRLKPLLAVMKARPFAWILWSTIGFGIFYVPLTFAAKYGPSWLVAGTWQVTIVAGMLIAPLLERKGNRQRIPPKAMLFSLIILSGVAVMQISQAGQITAVALLAGTVPVIIAAFAYPLGNRMMMKITEGKVDALQRTLGMTMASMPFWILVAITGFVEAGPPAGSLVFQSLLVAVTSGVIATTLFFKATDMAKGEHQLLASVEATQAGEVLFALLGEVILLGGSMPDLYSCVGIIIVIAGMVLHSRTGRPE